MKSRKKGYLLMFQLCFCGCLFSQYGNPHILPEYSFVKYEKNKLEFVEENRFFSALFAKMDTIVFKGKEKLSIAHFGGSHIQADVWSNQVRQSFQNFSPNINGGRGFIFPYSLAHTNNPYYYRVLSSAKWKGYRASLNKYKVYWGVSGVTAITKDSNATLNLTFPSKKSLMYRFNQVDVLHSIDSQSYKISSNDNQVLNTTIYPEEGFTRFNFKELTDTFSFKLLKTDSTQKKFELYGIILSDTTSSGIVYNSIGVNGASTATFLKCLGFKKHFKLIKPDLVIFSIGINDTYSKKYDEQKYFQNYDTIIKIIREVAPECAILFTTNSDSFFRRKYSNKKVFSSIKVMYKLAKKYDAAVWNLFDIMGGLGSINIWYKNGLAVRDRVHFSSKGYKLVGKLFFSAFAKSYAEYLSKTYGEEN